LVVFETRTKLATLVSSTVKTVIVQKPLRLSTVLRARHTAVERRVPPSGRR
jgi:hypothetical protein